MRLKLFHDHTWHLDAKQAIYLQNRLRQYVVLENKIDSPINRVAGVDVGFEAGGSITRAGAAVLDLADLHLLDQAVARLPTRFPYIPGLLSFREIPTILHALANLLRLPDMLLCDGQGYAHPRRFGLACHLGVLTDLPAIGVGKTRLLGDHAEIPNKRGEWVPLRHQKETIGAVLRSREGMKPIYVSVGHRLDLSTAVDYVMRCVTRYKLPETTRQAHRLASG